MIGYTKGITRSAGELMAEDGELMESINLKCENGELKPLLWPERAFQLNQGEELKYIHKGSGYENYLYISGGKVKAFSFEDGVRKDFSFEQTIRDIRAIESIGNTLVVSGSDGLHYILFKNGEYKYLGQHFPECPLSFGLQGELITYKKKYGDWLTVDFNERYPFENPVNIKLEDEDITIASNAILGAVNKMVYDLKDDGKFMFPFFVRYAYRLYDGTLTYHSAPVLMIAGSYSMPFTMCIPVTGDDGKGSRTTYNMVLPSCDLDYALVEESVKTQLEDWGDIVKSVDVFVSPQIHTYDSNKRVDEIGSYYIDKSNTTLYDEVVGMNKGSYGVFKLKGAFADVITNGFDNSTLALQYSRHYIPSLVSVSLTDSTIPNYVDVYKSVTSVDEEISSASNFYLLKSLSINELSTDRTVIGVEAHFLPSLESRERMEDDYRSHDTIKAGDMYSYNNRLNLHGVSRGRYAGYQPDSMVQFTNGAYHINAKNYGADGFELEDVGICSSFYSQIEAEDCTFAAKSSVYQSYDLREIGHYVFYPNNDGLQYRIGINNQFHEMMQAGSLSGHKYLNGVYKFNGLYGKNEADNHLMIEGGTPIVDEPNKIYTSEVNNPFVFIASGINTVGTGEVLGIVSVTKALSQGQFGQFPLLALCSDGIWALTVNEEGLYSTKQMVSREVCNNSDSIVQTDNAVYFSSEKGLMVIDGSDVRCVTPQMEGLPTKVSDMKRMPDILKSVSEIQEIVSCGESMTEFVDYLRESTIGYNYREESLYICHKDTETHRYLYVYSLKNNTLSKLCNPDEYVRGFVNRYPDTLMTGRKEEEGKTNVYSLLKSHELEGEAVYGFAMTRAMKLGNPAGMKRIKQVKNIKNVHDKNSYVKYSLWGSNDCVRWYYVGSYDGGFKYYRMGLFTKLRPNESALGTVMITDEKRSNKLR